MLCQCDDLEKPYIFFLSEMLPTDKNYRVLFQPGENVSYNYNSTIDCCYTYRNLSNILLLPNTIDLPFIWTLRRYSEIIYSISAWDLVGELN